MKMKGFGGFMYKHYLQVMPTCPKPWTVCAFINYLSTTAKGYAAWAKDIGDYPSMPSINTDRTKFGHGTLGADNKFTQKDSDYIYTVKTNYPNNPKYTKQNIILDKNYNLKKVEVQDDKNISYIEFTVKTIDKKANFNESEFSLEELTKDFNKASTNEEQTRKENSNNEESKQTENRNQEEQTNEQTNEEAKTDNETQSEDRNESKTNSETSQNNKTEETNETSKVDDKVFPLYLPSNTKLSDKEVIATESGERVIMTFAGDNPFILVQETVKPSKNLEIIPTYGEPYMLIDTVGSLTDTSYTWTSNGVEYYIVSDQMDKNELLEVAKSINVVSTINQK